MGAETHSARFARVSCLAYGRQPDITRSSNLNFGAVVLEKQRFGKLRQENRAVHS
jgi:hypothetical protein